MTILLLTPSPSIPATVLVAQTKSNTVPGLSRDVCRIRRIRCFAWEVREMVKTVTYEATGHCVAYYSIQQHIYNVLCATHIPNGYIWQYKNMLAADSRHFTFDRQYGTCTGIIYTLDTDITVLEGRYMFCAKNWLAIRYHNRHMSCPGLSPPDLSVYGR